MIKSITRRILPALLAALLLATALPALAAPLSGNAGLPAQLAALVGQAEATRLLSTSEGTAQAISLLRASGAIVPQQGFSTVQRPATAPEPELTGLEKAIADLRKEGAKVYSIERGKDTRLGEGDYFVFDEVLYQNGSKIWEYHDDQFKDDNGTVVAFKDFCTQIYPKPNK